MAHACVARTHQVAYLMQLSDLELRLTLSAITHESLLGGLHLCHELLAAQQYYPTRKRLPELIARQLRETSAALENQPHLVQ
jgi:hypothetical protein